ncbi:hypothetical protein KVR01_008026 [Diaporthe batatas]|uniref:uncharacterized protein n=1 Tax=Diaporthe batatas TaxID=748121 RepID=UPI001D0440BD|nr:uncharacterized protein KVR01_008026 [Diaporthe batatas]KAG8162261.1 hypothetical protein KVR01_008026 [Diaporthe batatas]
MAPPTIARIEANRRAREKVNASGWEAPISPNKVKKPVQERKQPKMELFPKFPAEIQQMIWGEVVRKPSCHTFRFIQKKVDGKTRMDIVADISSRDNSPWRYWKSLLYCRKYKQPMDDSDEAAKKKKSSKAGGDKPKAVKPKAEKPKLEGLDLEKFKVEKKNFDPRSLKKNVQKSHEAFSKLANLSFQVGFRRSMRQPKNIITPPPTGIRERARGAAASDLTIIEFDRAVIDAATDLVILEFNRGENAPPNSWFEHTGMGRLDIDAIRRNTMDLKRVAVHYKKTHAKADKRGPFQCWCHNPGRLGCYRFKACPMEQACFLDCFANLEEFYYVIEIPGRKAADWLHTYRRNARMFDYNIKTWPFGDKEGPRMPLVHFYDRKFEYVQLPAVHRLKEIGQWINELPFEAHREARDCLQTVISIYKGKKDNELYNTPLVKRVNVKFGILVAFKLDEETRE